MEKPVLLTNSAAPTSGTRQPVVQTSVPESGTTGSLPHKQRLGSVARVSCVGGRPGRRVRPAAVRAVGAAEAGPPQAPCRRPHRGDDRGRAAACALPPSAPWRRPSNSSLAGNAGVGTRERKEQKRCLAEQKRSGGKKGGLCLFWRAVVSRRDLFPPKVGGLCGASSFSFLCIFLEENCRFGEAKSLSDFSPCRQRSQFRRRRASAVVSRLRPGRMLPHAPSRYPGAVKFKPLVPTKPPLAPASSSSSRGNLCTAAASRRDFLLLVPSLAAASTALQYLPLEASAADDEKPAPPPPAAPAPAPAPPPAGEPEGEALSRMYDATVIGEPQAVGKDARGRVWEKLMAARVVYLGEAELVPDRDDRVLELEIVKKLAARCADAGRSLSLSLEAFPCDLQEQLNQFMDGRLEGKDLKLYTSHWAPERWQEYEPLLNYCRDNGIKLIACGTPLEVVRTVQAEGINGLSKANRKLYAPPAGSGFISGFTSISG
ncbi:hypothetical protein ACQ4PT_071657 [Festuca glaucescens]